MQYYMHSVVHVYMVNTMQHYMHSVVHVSWLLLTQGGGGGPPETGPHGGCVEYRGGKRGESPTGSCMLML